MDTRVLSMFLEAARAGGFAAAARRLDRDPSAISRAVAQLEADLGVRLFQRTTRKVSLTEAGARFAAKIEPVLTELEEATEAARSERSQPKGKLCVSASVAFGQVCLLPQIPAFLERYPEIELELRLADENVDLVAERIDLAIRLAPSVEADVIAAKLAPTRYRVCASPGYLDAHGAPHSPSDIADRPAVCFDLPGFRSLWQIRRSDGETDDVPVTPRLTITSALAVREACLLGLGPALLADWLVRDDLAAGRLVDLFPERDATATTFDTAAWILYPSRRFLPRKTRLMIDFLRETLGRSAAAPKTGRAQPV